MLWGEGEWCDLYYLPCCGARENGVISTIYHAVGQGRMVRSLLATMLWGEGEWCDCITNTKQDMHIEREYRTSCIFIKLGLHGSL